MGNIIIWHSKNGYLCYRTCAVSYNKIEVSQYISKEEMEELGFTEEELKPICPFTGSSDLEELGHMPEDDLRHFAYTDIEGVKKYFKEREGK